jgi:FkbM family methyltransferase
MTSILNKVKIFSKKVLNRLFVKPKQPEWVNISSGPLIGGKLFIDEKSFVGWSEMISGTYDSFIYDEINKESANGKVIWDIGAHFGYHSLCFSSVVGVNGHVYSFEPNPFNIERFKINVVNNPELAKRISLNTNALSDTDGVSSFIFSNDVDGSRSSGSHIIGATKPLLDSDYNNFSKQEVNTIKIDSLIRGGNLRIPDILKIDVEGAELMVLNGASTFFEKHKPIIFMEVHNILMMFYVQKFLISHGYDINILNQSESTLSRCFIVARVK